jgi:hypothetical protein
MSKSKPVTASELPITGSIPEAGKLFFGVNKEAAYRLARAGIIPTVETGSRNKRALLHVLQRRLTTDPQNDGGGEAAI